MLFITVSASLDRAVRGGGGGVATCGDQHNNTHTHTHARAHTHAHTHTHTHTHTVLPCSQSLGCSVFADICPPLEGPVATHSETGQEKSNSVTLWY